MNKVFYDCTLQELRDIIKAVQTLAEIDQSDSLVIEVKGTFVDRKNELVFLTTHFSEIKISSVGKGQFITAMVDDCFIDIKLTGKYKRLDVRVTF